MRLSKLLLRLLRLDELLEDHLQDLLAGHLPCGQSDALKPARLKVVLWMARGGVPWVHVVPKRSAPRYLVVVRVREQVVVTRGPLLEDAQERAVAEDYARRRGVGADDTPVTASDRVRLSLISRLYLDGPVLEQAVIRLTGQNALYISPSVAGRARTHGASRVRRKLCASFY